MIVAATIRNVVVSDRTTWRHVIVETDSGLTGIGEATHEPVRTKFSEKFQSAAGSLVGRQLDEECLNHLASMKTGDLEARSIHSAISQAVSDLRARQNGVPVRVLLGGSAEDYEIPLYANINRISRDRSPASFARNAKAAGREGFSAVKIAAFDGLTPALCSAGEAVDLINLGLDRLNAVAEAMPGAEIMVDCHWRFDQGTAAALIPALKDIGVCWFECPLQETLDNVDALAALRRSANKAGIRLCGLETFGGWQEIQPFVDAGAYDVIMPDVKHAGSLDTIIEISEEAARRDVAVSLHNPTGPVAHFFSEQVAAVIGGRERLEIQWRESPIFFELTDPSPDLSDGLCRPSARPGLGAAFVSGRASSNSGQFANQETNR